MDANIKIVFNKLYNEENELHDRIVDAMLEKLIEKDPVTCIQALFDAKKNGEDEKKY